jgi:WS/DGAT/MGAT family acyltransferase
MDRRKPLWDMTLVSGLAGGRGAIIARVHHCMADGIAGVKLLHVLLDPNPKAGVPRVKRQRPAPAPAGANIPFVDGLLTSYSEIFDRLVSIQSYALNVAEAVLAQGVGAVYQLFRMGPDLFGPFEGLPFNQPCQGARKLVWTELPLAEVNAVREACGVKLNDVVLSLVTTAVRRYTQLHRAPVRGRTLRMMVPVNIRGRDGIGGENLGNRISMIPVNVPLDITDPVAQLRRMSETTAALKGGGVADFVGVAGNCLGLLPTPLQAMLGPYGSDLPFPPWNMVCTNVPGPQIPLYMLGRKLVAMYPYVPIGARMGLNCAVQSYDRNLYFGFTGSIAAAPDADVMPGLVEKAFAELCKRARVKRAEAAPVHRTQRSGRARSNGHLAGPAVAVAGAADVTAATPNGSGVVPAATQ